MTVGLSWISLMEPDDAVAGSVFAAFVATSVTILSGLSRYSRTSLHAG